MSLLQRYTDSTSATIVQAKTLGEIASPGVDFLDGTPRTRTPAADTVQTEFTPNETGAFKYDGKSKKPAATNDKSYPLSRWLEKGVKRSDTYVADPQRTQISNIRNKPGTVVHKFSQLDAKSFFEAGGLSEFAKARANPNSSTYGPGPSGVNG
jgi:hypothetical protein